MFYFLSESIFFICLIENTAECTVSGTHAYGDIYVQRAAAHADVTTSSRSG